MTGWIILLLLALTAFAALWRIGGLRGRALNLLGAAMLAGAVGYGWQGAPGLPGQPVPPPADTTKPDSAFAVERNRLLERFGSDAEVLDAADAMHRAGLDAYGVGLIRGALEKRPQSAELWIGMGNSLTLYAGGLVTPAAELAFKRAATIAPDHPAPSFFLGLAYAQAGQLDRANEVWRALLARTPPDAPWRADIEQRLAAIEAMR